MLSQEYKSNCNIVLDFYDSNKIATWVREYPNMILWVRDKIGELLMGGEDMINGQISRKRTILSFFQMKKNAFTITQRAKSLQF